MRICGLTLACLVAASICSAASAAESNPLEPAVYWRMAFGAPNQSPVLGYGFALHHDTDRAAPALLQFDVSQTGTLARLAGVPMTARAFKLDQADEAGTDTEVEQAVRSPWYARQWVWWTGAGLAATGALIAGFTEEKSSSGSSSSSSSEDCGGGGCGFACINGECTVPCGSFPQCLALLPESRMERLVTLPAYEPEADDDTGHMGDLVAR